MNHAKKSRTFNPKTEPRRKLELYSIPRHELKIPEVVVSSDIGSSKQFVESGDVLLSKINPRLNRVWVVGNPSHYEKVASTEWIVFSKSEYATADFLNYLLQTYQIRDYLSHNASGVGGSLMRVNPSLVDTIRIGLPPLNEQREIVAKIEELFGELDQGVAALERAQAQLRTYRQALLKHAFEGKLTAEWREANQDKLESAATLLARIKAERKARYAAEVAAWEARGKMGRKPPELNDLPPLREEELREMPALPDGWAYVYLQELGDLGRGKSKHRPRNDPRLFGGPYPFIQTGEVKAANKIIRTFDQTYSEFGLAQSKLWIKGTLCITIAANIAETAFLGFDGCFPDSVVGFSAFEKLTQSEFVDYFIRSARSKIDAYAPATAQKNINLTTLENLVVPYCSILEQNEAVMILDERFSVIEQLEQTITMTLQQAAILRQAILKKAFAGQLVPQDPHDEPASALLARIRAT